MAITHIEQKYGTGEGTYNTDWTREYDITLVVKCDALHGTDYIWSNCGVAYGDHYSVNYGAYTGGSESNLLSVAKTFKTRRTGAYLWEVDIHYAPWSPLEIATSGDGNPLHIPPEVRFDFFPQEFVCYTDKHGNPIVNSSGQRFANPIKKDITRGTLKITRNESYGSSGFDPHTVVALSNTLNSVTWHSFPAGSWKLSPPQLEKQQYNPICGVYWKISYEFSYLSTGWSKIILDEGTRRLSGGQPVPIFKDGIEVKTPTLLDGSGQPLAMPITSVNAFPLTFELYDLLDFEATFSFGNIFG